MFDNLQGKSSISTSYTFNKGIPDGKWKSYEHGHETFQEGVFTPLKDISSLKYLFPYSTRINICRYYEGDYKLTDIFVISTKSDTINFIEKKKQIIEYLIDKKYLSINKPVDTCYLVLGEF